MTETKKDGRRYLALFHCLKATNGPNMALISRVGPESVKIL